MQFPYIAIEKRDGRHPPPITGTSDARGTLPIVPHTFGTASRTLSQIENDKHELEIQMMDRVGNLESAILNSASSYGRFEADKRYIETQKIRYEREVRKLKSESEQLRSPPLSSVLLPM